MELQPLRIAIIGSGVAGLTLAGTLAKFGDPARLQVALYEATASFDEFGAGFAIWGRSFQVMRALGLEDELAAIDTSGSAQDSDSSFSFSVRRSDKGEVGYEFTRRAFARGAGFHRAEFRDVLARNLARAPNVTVHFEKRLINAARTGDGYTLHFKDGSSVTCDVLLGADGVRSPVRSVMLDFAAHDLGDEALRALAPAVWSGEAIYRALVSPARLAEEFAKMGGEGDHRVLKEHVMYCGQGRNAVVYPIQNGTVINVGLFFANPPKPADDEHWSSAVDSAILRTELADFEIEARAVMQSVSTATRWAIFVVQPLPFFAHGGIAVLGDAAHAMTPHNASGVNQAIEDAYVLGRLLADPRTTRASAHVALSAYDGARRPRSQAIATLSKRLGQLGNFTSGEDEASTAAELRTAGIWVLEGDMNADVEGALQTMQTLLG